MLKLELDRLKGGQVSGTDVALQQVEGFGCFYRVGEVRIWGRNENHYQLYRAHSRGTLPGANPNRPLQNGSIF